MLLSGAIDADPIHQRTLIMKRRLFLGALAVLWMGSASAQDAKNPAETKYLAFQVFTNYTMKWEEAEKSADSILKLTGGMQ